jgi:hypothetical protein
MLSQVTAVWCPGAESNHRHEDFQSTALPTELPGLGYIEIFSYREKHGIKSCEPDFVKVYSLLGT